MCAASLAGQGYGVLSVKRALARLWGLNGPFFGICRRALLSEVDLAMDDRTTARRVESRGKRLGRGAVLRRTGLILMKRLLC